MGYLAAGVADSFLPHADVDHRKSMAIEVLGRRNTTEKILTRSGAWEWVVPADDALLHGHGETGMRR